MMNKVRTLELTLKCVGGGRAREQCGRCGARVLCGCGWSGKGSGGARESEPKGVRDIKACVSLGFPYIFFARKGFLIFGT